jgi:membrane fusion protein (multidrug efflux system)
MQTVFGGKMRGCVALSLAVVLICGCKKGGGGGPPQAPPTEVEAERVSTAEVVETLAAVGTIQPNESVEIKSEAEGVIKAIHFTEGQVVEAGQKLFELDAGKEAAQLARARADSEIARITLERSKTLAGTKAISQQEIDDWKARLAAREAEVALYQEQLSDTVVLAPFRGVVGSRHVSIGQYVSPMVVLVTLVDQSQVKVTYHIPERDLARVRTKQPVQLRVAAYPDRTFTGQVDLIDPVVNPATRMVQLRALAPNSDGLLKPGMFAQVETVVDRRPDAVVISERALVPSLRGFDVFVIKDGTAVLQTVKIGVRQPGKVEIAEGLTAGQEIVVGGTQKLVDGAKVAIAAAPVPPKPVAAGGVAEHSE